MMNSLVERSRKAVWHPCTQMKQHETLPLIPVVRGSGGWLFDDQGQRTLDLISSWWTNLFGHANPRINQAIKEQLDTLEHVMLAGFTHPPVVELSERLSALTDHELGHCFYASDGASATEIALKMSFHAWRNQGLSNKREFACLEGGYHGETVGALSVTDVSLFREAYAPLVRPSVVLPSPDARRAKEGERAEDVALRAAQAVEHYLIEHHERMAALIVEPLIQCASGFAMHHPRYLTELRRLCDRYRIHLIFDEIAVGFGRSGSFFAHEQAPPLNNRAVRPDFLCLSKGITGGYLPLSVVLTRDSIYQAFYDDNIARGFLHSHSYTGNPLACRAALATLDIFTSDHILQRNRRWGDQLTTALAPIMGHPQVKHFRRTGMIWAFDVDLPWDPASSYSSSSSWNTRFFQEGRARELLLRPIGQTVYLMPPYVLEEEDCELIGQRLLATLEASLEGTATHGVSGS